MVCCTCTSSFSLEDLFRAVIWSRTLLFFKSHSCDYLDNFLFSLPLLSAHLLIFIIARALFYHCFKEHFSGCELYCLYALTIFDVLCMVSLLDIYTFFHHCFLCTLHFWFDAQYFWFIHISRIGSSFFLHHFIVTLGVLLIVAFIVFIAIYAHCTFIGELLLFTLSLHVIMRTVVYIHLDWILILLPFVTTYWVEASLIVHYIYLCTFISELTLFIILWFAHWFMPLSFIFFLLVIWKIV